MLKKSIADGTVLDMIWKWLKAGYMGEGKHRHKQREYTLEQYITYMKEKQKKK